MTKKTFLFITVILVIVVCCFTYCKKDKYAIPVCYDTDVQPILTAKCALSGCHDATTSTGGINFTSYSAFENNDKKQKILEVINEGIMPPSGRTPLTIDEKKIIARWAARGYGKGTCSTNNVCDTTISITYNNNVKIIFDTYCISSGCHNSMTMAGGYALDNYTGCKNAAQSGRLLGAIKWLPGYSPMPKGGGKLSDCDIMKIEKWINSGMPN